MQGLKQNISVTEIKPLFHMACGPSHTVNSMSWPQSTLTPCFETLVGSKAGTLKAVHRTGTRTAGFKWVKVVSFLSVYWKWNKSLTCIHGSDKLYIYRKLFLVHITNHLQLCLKPHHCPQSPSPNTGAHAHTHTHTHRHCGRYTANWSAHKRVYVQWILWKWIY